MRKFSPGAATIFQSSPVFTSTRAGGMFFVPMGPPRARFEKRHAKIGIAFIPLVVDNLTAW
ncbi:hypothetical protein LZK73_16900 [Neorhizobium galegae]|nr:hypothetical protein LZK73_16900 [Neorhizobium galegae]